MDAFVAARAPLRLESRHRDFRIISSRLRHDSCARFEKLREIPRAPHRVLHMPFPLSNLGKWHRTELRYRYL